MNMYTRFPLCLHPYLDEVIQTKTEVFLVRKEILVIQTSEDVYKIILLSLVNNIPHHFTLLIATAYLTDTAYAEFLNRQLLKSKYKSNSKINHRKAD